MFWSIALDGIYAPKIGTKCIPSLVVEGSMEKKVSLKFLGLMNPLFSYHKEIYLMVT